jgi:hypothetical protein
MQPEDYLGWSLETRAEPPWLTDDARIKGVAV